jgi:hypothetical protein
MQTVFGRNFPSIFLFILAFSVVGFAQDLDNVTISGQVTDSNNAPIVGANVTAILLSTGVERTVVTDDEGRFLIVKLEPGTYSVKFSANGFGTKEQKDLATVAGQNVQLNISLAPAGVTAEQTITIDGDDAPAVDTTRTVVGGTVAQRDIEELPNNTRNPLDLVFTLGGVAEEPLSTRDLANDKGARGETAGNAYSPLVEGGVFSLSGGAAYSNNITIDGLDNNDDRAASFRFQPSADAISEVQVITNQFSSEYGRASGGRVNFRTRSGGKKFRGRFTYLFRDDAFNANTWRNNSRGIARPNLQENIPVVSLGGPIPFGYFKNKTFFFAAYEYQNVKEDTIIDTYVPVATNSRFAIPSSTNTAGQVCESTALVGGVSVCSTATPTAAFIAPFIEGVPTPLRNHTLSARLDHNFTDLHSLNFNFQYGKRQDFRQFSGGSRLAEALVGNSRDTQGYSFTDNYVFSPNVVNQARFQYSTFKPQVINDGSLTNPVVLITLPSALDRGTLVAGSSTTGSSDRQEDRWQFQDTLTYLVGAHSLKFGGDVQRVKSVFIDRGDATGTYSFGSLNNNLPVQNFLQNKVTRYRHNFDTTSVKNNTYYGFFVQDDWKILPNLTFNFGVRYERETIVDDNNNWGPRVGVAWSPYKDNKTAIRFGGGIFYNRALLRTLDLFTLTTNSLIFDTNSITTTGGARQAVLDAISVKFPNALTIDEARQFCTTNNINCGNAAFNATIDPNLKIPESYQFNGGIERELGNGFVIEANYTYNKTIHLWRQFNANSVSLAKLNSVTGGNFQSIADYLLSRDFNNNPVSGTRPFLGGTSSTAGNFIRFVLTPFNNSAPGAQVGVISNPDLGGVICINGAATCVNATNNPNQNRYYLLNLNSLTATNGSSPIIAALAILNQFRPNPTGAPQIDQLASIGNSQYNGMILELRRRFRPLGYGFGSSLRLVYTVSELLDDGLVNTSSAQINGDFQSDWARSVQDRRHRLVLSGTLATPSWLGKLNFTPIIKLASGAPFNLSGGGVDRNLDDVNTDRPNYFGYLSDIVWREPDSAIPQNVLDSIKFPIIGSNGGNLGRNAGRGPSLFIFDLNVSREFKFSERFKLRPNIELNNVLNARVFSYGTAFINANSSTTTFLVPTRTYRPREIRLGIRFDF